ncbi:MAG TPA: type II toxin-antitoxin system VapC family toxin, partial [Gemmatales bacterium]|nr:type II toxin-antitoxin system VapC family toxin [Gemmatales bacterium]
WIWWMDDPDQLPAKYREYLAFRADGELAVSAISCWELAKLVECNRLKLTVDAANWIASGLEPAITSIPLTSDIAVESTQLPGDFHKDPADRFIVATARLLKCPLVTMDQKIREYPHVILAP